MVAAEAKVPSLGWVRDNCTPLVAVAAADIRAPVVAEAAAAAAREYKEVEKAESTVPETVYTPPAPIPVPVPEPEGDVFGIPRDLLLPASIGVLAAVIIGVFTISRLTSD